MGPKKKKKPASNPARGFATVSLPSKAKAEDSALQAQNLTTDADNNGSISHEPHSAVEMTQYLREPSFQDMTAEQLELHLEDAELQNIVEKSAERSRQVAARQVARLETECRTLRAQALPLETNDWLTEGLVEEIVHLHQSSKGEYEKSAWLSQRDKHMQQDDLLVKLWTLQQVLKLLHLPHEEQVLKYVVSLISNRTLSSKDYIWGLEESSDWLALHASTQELPTYQPSVTLPRPIQIERGILTSSSEGSRTTSPTRPIGDTSVVSDVTPTTATTPVHKELDRVDRPDMQSMLSVDGDDSTDDDNDPDKLVSRYVDFNLQLLKMEPEFRDGTGTTEEAEHEQQRKASQINRLRQKIETIQRDILFDYHNANAQLSESVNQFRADFSTRRAELGLVLPSQEVSYTAAYPQAPVEATEAALDSMDNEDVGDGLFGDMFAAAQTFTPKDRPTTQNEDNESMLLIDFGKWSGISPRRILEDTCKTKDTGSAVSFELISSTTYSNRHKVQIKWSRYQQQELSLTALPIRLSYDTGPFKIEIEMQSIATSTRQQSEGYISTVALFVLCANEAKDEKVFLRLPQVWRDLWADLLSQRQAEIALSDKSVLRQIRSMILEQESKPEGSENKSLLMTEHSEHEHIRDSSIFQKPKGLQTTGEHLCAEWINKSSTPRYQTMFLSRQKLPIFEHRDRIIKSIDAQQVTILCAETGAGKSTQVPAFILENELSLGRNCRILVTQPRRISAMSLARRVSEEFGEAKADIGTHRSLVGFAIRLESKTTSSTRITYATTGVLLRMLEDSRELDEISHLVLDEVHERTLDLDLAFVAIKRMIQFRPGLKLVLMSATVDAAKFSAYFENAPVLSIPGRTFPVEIRYLEDAVEHTIDQHSNGEMQSLEDGTEDALDDFDENQRIKSIITGLDNYSPKTRAVIAAYDEYRIDYALIANLAAFIASHKMYTRFSAAILIFMPGIAEIRRLHHTFLSHGFFKDGWSFNLLHSSFSSEDLEAAFMAPPFGTRKIVIATNIAETGITIPDITAVIDTCKEKTMRFDERRQISKLTENFTSKSSCRQRRGRAARVQEGLCFHLITKYRFENLLPEQHVPEMLRLSLQEPALRLKIWGFGDIEETLSQALDPPTGKNIRRAVDALKDVKALTSSELLTPLGRQLARLPLDIWLGKLVILGIAFACLDAGITIASMMSSKSPFVVSNRTDTRAENAKLAFQRGDSDLLLNYNAYLAWRRTCQTGNASDFCRKNYLDHQALSQIEDQKVQLMVALGDTGLLRLEDAEKSLLRKARSRSSGRNREFFMVPKRYTTNDMNNSVLASLFAQAFYPKLLVREGKGWRNISTNQQVNLAPTSINKFPAKPPQWLCFHQAMQTRSKLPTVFDTSAVPESAIILLLGDVEFKMFAGVIAIDGNKIRFRVRTWKTLMALKILRGRVNDVLTYMIQSPGKPLTPSLQAWADLWHKVFKPIEDVKLQALPFQRR